MGTGYMFPPRWQAPQLKASLAGFNRRWMHRYAVFLQYAGPPCWAPGAVIDRPLRILYDRFLPIDEFLRDLYTVAQFALPHPSWIPAALRSRQTGPGCSPQEPCKSLPDLWAHLPPVFSGKLTFSESELVSLLCALADPLQYGTSPDRYPEQLLLLRSYVSEKSTTGTTCLDIGCGVGLGTYELADTLGLGRSPATRVTGITIEPLEAWMALHCCLPHDSRRAAYYPAAKPHFVDFLCSHALSIPLTQPFDCVIVNGLAGGPNLFAERDLRQLLDALQQVCAPHGIVSLANRFHDGWMRHVDRFLSLAAAGGWYVTGHPKLAVLQRNRGKS